MGTSLILANCLKLTKKYITLAELRNSYEEEVAAFEAKSVGLLQVSNLLRFILNASFRAVMKVIMTAHYW